MLTVIQCCMGGNAANADFLRPIIDKLGMKLVTISEWENHDVKWDQKTWLSKLNEADIVVCTQRHTTQPAKSNNRVTQSQYLGKPVCASPLPAYLEAIDDGITGFICSTPEEWEDKLKLLRDDIELRNKIGARARLSAKELYSIDAVGAFWLHTLSRLSKEACDPPKVDIIIPTWNNLHLLQECVKSIRSNTDWPYNIIVVNSGFDRTNEWLSSQPDIIYKSVPDRLHFSSAVNAGLAISKEKFVCLLNDDTIVAKHWLTALMHEAMKPNVGAVNPWSNCDLGWMHNEEWVVDGIKLHPGMTYDSVREIIPKLYEQKHQKVVTVRDWVAFFCTVLPREAIDKVGLLDENFKSGCEDLDYCKRLAVAGYRFVTTFDSWVFHFGGSSRKNAEKISFEIHHQEDNDNHEYMRNKWNPATLNNIRSVLTKSSNKKRTLVVYTGPALEKWSPKNVDVGGIGGSETCVVNMCREFAKRGYDVSVYGDPQDLAGVYDGVKYYQHDTFNPTDHVDVFISSRRPDVFSLPINADKKICWVHDIWVHNNPNAYIFQDKIDKFFVLSRWHRDFFCEHHGIPASQTYLTRNAIDLSRFAYDVPRVRGRMIYSSSPDRGLDVLLDCMPLIRSKVPSAHLKVFYGFFNWKMSVKSRNNPHEIAWMNRIEERLSQPGVEYVGRVGQKELAHEFLQSELWAYPTNFTETSCITAMEAMAAGVPAIVSNLAALQTTVGVEGGVLIDGDNTSEAYRNAFVQVCVHVLSNRYVWEELSTRSRRRASGYGLEQLVDEWIVELER